MPVANNDGVALYYETDGTGETVTFVGDVGFGAWQWAWQAPAVAGPYETLVWDLRGTGRSDSPHGPYSMDDLVTDLETVLKDSATRRTHLVGAGLGGMVALHYAQQYSRAMTLTLFNTAANGSAIDRTTLENFYPTERTEEAIRSSLAGAFSEEFRETQPETLDQICEWRLDEDAPPAVTEKQVDTLCSSELGPLYEITLPTLVCHGVADPVVDITDGRTLAETLPRGTFEAVEGKRLCFIEHSRPVTDRLFAFLDEQTDRG